MKNNIVTLVRRSVGLNELYQNEVTKELARMYKLEEKYVYKIDNFYMNELYVNKDIGFVVPLMDVCYSTSAIQNLANVMTKAINDGDFEAVINYTDGQFALMVYEIIENRIPQEEKYKIFIKAYNKTDFNFEKASENIDVEGLLDSHRLDEEMKNKLELQFGEDDDIIIYRGQGSKSCSLEKSISWTTSLDVAKRFAEIHNLEGDGQIYQASVNINDITDYIVNRDEDEIIVDYKYLKLLNPSEITV